MRVWELNTVPLNRIEEALIILNARRQAAMGTAEKVKAMGVFDVGSMYE